MRMEESMSKTCFSCLPMLTCAVQDTGHDRTFAYRLHYMQQPCLLAEALHICPSSSTVPLGCCVLTILLSCGLPVGISTLKVK